MSNLRSKAPEAEPLVSHVFTLDPNNFHRVVTSDQQVSVEVEYYALPATSYIHYLSKQQNISLCFESHRNRSCTIFIGPDQIISQIVIDDLKQALFVLGFNQDIAFNLL